MNNKRNLLPDFLITGEKTIRFSFGNEITKETFLAVHSFQKFIEEHWSYEVQEIVPSYHTVTVFLEEYCCTEKMDTIKLLDKWCEFDQVTEKKYNRIISLPVCYEAPFAEDIDRISEYTGLSQNEIIQMHSQTVYTVYMIGFLPGFPYLGELPEALLVPRLDKPRLNVPRGAVGIGGSQTGIYPISSPGGWNILGRTPFEIFNPNRAEPFLLQAGDQIKFVSISHKKYLEYEKMVFENKVNLEQLVKGLEI